jgi:hypothetical protein
MDSLPQIAFSLVCDDVRREDNGKLIIIGVYGENITVPQTPTNLILCLVLFVETQEEFRAQATFRVKMGATILTQAPINLDYKKGKSTVAISAIPVGIEKPGDLLFELHIQGEENPRILKTIPLISVSALESRATAS